MYPAKTEPMTENTTHSSIGCNGMANNYAYHLLEMYKNHAKDSTTEGCMQPDPTNMICGRNNPSKVKAMLLWAVTEPMIKNSTHSSISCNGMANNDDYHGPEMYKNHAKDSTTEGYMQPDPTNNNNKHLRCGNRKGLLGRNDQTHHRMDPNTMASRPPTKQY